MSFENYLPIFFVGFFGSMHCIGMCGGFVAMYSLRKPATDPSLAYHLLYNLGRITTYSVIGGVFGYLGSFLAYLGKLRGIPGGVLLLAGLLMILMGLNIAGILGKRGFFEESGITESSFFRKVMHRILAMDTLWATYLLGLLLGLLPCGLLYPIFINAAASGGFVPGGITLAVFGLGTVPAMLSFGFLVTRIRPWMKSILYRVAAILIVILGVQTVLRGLAWSGVIPPSRLW